MNLEKLFIESELHRLLQLIKCDRTQKTNKTYTGPVVTRLDENGDSVRIFGEWIDKMRGHKVSSHAKSSAVKISGCFVPFIDDL